MKLKYILSAAILALGFSSCSIDSELTVNESKVPLQIKTQIQSTRAGIDATQFDNGDQIGVFMQKDGKWSSDCFNVSAATSDYGKSWKLSKGVMLDKTPASLYAYYPWNESVSTKDGILLGIDMRTQTNYLYGFVKGVRDESPVANILFRHALAKVDFLIQNDMEKEISKVTLSGEELLTTGQFNVATLTFTPTATGEIVSNNVTFINETQSNACFLLPPMTEQQLNIRVEYADGGSVYEGTFMASNISMGKHVQYSVNIQRGTEMEISETSIEEWGEAENMGDVTLKESKIDANGREYVDLGLPSGTLWATCNVGAKSPEEYGDYFAWGEYNPKTYFTYDNHYYNDTPDVLPLEYDAAHVLWKGDWRIPTYDEFQELSEQCDWRLSSLHDKPVCEIKSKKNGKSIFLPMAGYYEVENYLQSVGENGRYWTSSLYKSGNAWFTCISNYEYSFSYIEPHVTYSGLTIRPVLGK